MPSPVEMLTSRKERQEERGRKQEEEQVKEPAELKTQAHPASSEDDWAPTRPPAFRPNEEPDVTDEPREGGGTHQMMWSCVVSRVTA